MAQGKYVGLDLGGTTINVTAFDGENFLVPGMHEIPSLVSSGPEVCLNQLRIAYQAALNLTGWSHEDVTAVGLDTPGPASATGVMSSTGGTNFGHAGYGHFDMRGGLADLIGKPTTYLNDANAAALYGHRATFGDDPTKTTVSLIIGTGLGGGIVVNGRIVVGRVGYAAELGHTRLPGDWHPTESIQAKCNCGRINDLESIVSLTGIRLNLLPYFLPRFPDHRLAGMEIGDAAKKVRGLAEDGDPLGQLIFRTQAHAIAAHIDQMINILDPDAILLGGGGVQTSEAFHAWFLNEIRTACTFREEQADLAILFVEDGDMAGARGSAIYAAQQYPVD